MIEQCIDFAGPDGLVRRGIVSKPTDAARTGVVLLPAGLKYHAGPHRLNVLLARRLVAMGYVVLRFDPAGIGESDGSLGPAPVRALWSGVEHGLFSDDALLASRVLRERFGVSSIVACGLCGGAITAQIAAASAPDSINGVISIASPVTTSPTDQESRSIGEKLARRILHSYLKKLVSLEAWSRLLRRESDLRGIAATVRVALSPRKNRTDGADVPANFNALYLQSFESIRAAGIPHLMVFGASDNRWVEFDEYVLKTHLRARTECEDYSIRVIPEGNHELQQTRSQALAMSHIEQWLASRFPVAARPAMMEDAAGLTPQARRAPGVSTAGAADRQPRAGVTPKRILLVVDGFYPSTGGSEMQVGLLARAFRAHGHEVTILAPHLDKSLPLRDTVDDVPVERIPYPRIRILGALVLDIRFMARLIARRRRYDAIHVHMAKNLAAAAGLIRPLLPSTLAVKISGAWEFDGGILDPERRTRPLYRLINGCVKRADNIQCVSEYTRRRLLDAGYPEDRLRMIPNAVDLERFVPTPIGQRKCKAVFVGRLVPVKALPILLQAWARARLSPDAILEIAGDGPERASLQAQSQALGVADRVRFLGEVSDVPGVLREASVYVQPSYQEGMPNSVLEAMACGLPIVASRVSGNEDLVVHEHNGLLVPAGDPDALAAAIERVLGNRELARSMGEASRDFVVARYSVPAVVAELLESYEKVARR